MKKEIFFSKTNKNWKIFNSYSNTRNLFRKQHIKINKKISLKSN